jgi:hypothetical protein
MTLHCASRLGFLSSLYQQRHKIAFTLGLISEVPIAMCNSDHNLEQNFIIQNDTETESTVPPIAFQAQEIQLFCNDFMDTSSDPTRALSLIDNQSFIIDRAYSTPALSIFHPPS